MKNTVQYKRMHWMSKRDDNRRRPIHPTYWFNGNTQRLGEITWTGCDGSTVTCNVMPTTYCRHPGNCSIHSGRVWVMP